jgi:hypothetical protein
MKDSGGRLPYRYLKNTLSTHSVTVKYTSTGFCSNRGTFFFLTIRIEKPRFWNPWHVGTDSDPRIISLTNGFVSGSGSCYFRKWPSRLQLKNICSVRGYKLLTPRELAINWHIFHKASRILHHIGSAYKRRWYTCEDFLSPHIRC